MPAIRSRIRLHLSICAVCFWIAAAGAQVTATPEIPPRFKLDLETAARLKPELVAQSVPATGRYATGQLVFERLLLYVQPPSSAKPTWQLRIVEDNQFNAYASPDGTLYVENGLASLAGPSAGLWAAILAHEIAHVTRRDWARRYLYQKRIENSSAAAIALGDPGQVATTWTDNEAASADLGKFCRQIELSADRESLMLMARAGYHPDFVPSLHHLLHARGSGPQNASLYAMHPCWEERDREMGNAYLQASIEFDHRWREWFASPGGNPPVLVFADPPSVKKIGPREWQIEVPMRCQNLVGAVEVVLRADRGRKERLLTEPSGSDDRKNELRQLTGCTSPRTTVRFTASDLTLEPKAGIRWTDVYVIDAWGSVLARTDVPKLPH